MSKKETLSGREPEGDFPGAPADIDPKTGMNKDYWVLSEEERKKGYTRPYRTSYVHGTCGVQTKMHHKFAETYAVDPKFYGSTFCCGCKTHFSVSEFTWYDSDEKVGS